MSEPAVVFGVGKQWQVHTRERMQSPSEPGQFVTGAVLALWSLMSPKPSSPAPVRVMWVRMSPALHGGKEAVGGRKAVPYTCCHCQGGGAMLCHQEVKSCCG